MHPPNRNTTETILGTTYVREDLLRQEAHNPIAVTLQGQILAPIPPVARLVTEMVVAIHLDGHAQPP